MNNIYKIIIILCVILISSCEKNNFQINPKLNEIILCEDYISVNDFLEIENILSSALDQTQSLDEFYWWIRSQKCVASARMGGGVIETLPPQREVIVKFRTGNFNTVKKAIDVALLDNNKFKFVRMHD